MLHQIKAGTINMIEEIQMATEKQPSNPQEPRPHDKEISEIVQEIAQNIPGSVKRTGQDDPEFRRKVEEISRKVVEETPFNDI
jgi:hypothetical protein